MTDLQEVLRLELERDPDPGELINLVPNPSGDLGAWGWETPIAGSNLRSVRVSNVTRLTYNSPGGKASHFYTEPIVVAAGQWVAASWMADVVAGLYQVRIEWLDDGAVSGATTPTSNFPASESVRSYGAYQAPAGTTHCRLRFDHYATGGGHPGTGTFVALRDVTVSAAASSGGLATTRTNLLFNPSAEGGTTYWGAEGGFLSTSLAEHYVGTRSFRLAADADSGNVLLLGLVGGIVGGRDYALQARVRPGSTPRQARIAARWYGPKGLISTARGAVIDEASGSWSLLAGVVTAPTGATSMQLRVVWEGCSPNEVHFADALMVERSSTAGPYFDGASSGGGGITYGWTGAAHASTSTETRSAGNLGTLVPVPYQNILGPSASVDINREDLNVGSLSVKVLDANLDPSQSGLVSPGKRVRLVALTSSGPEVVFSGNVLTGSATYHLLRSNVSKRAEVTIEAVDPIQTLASATPRREGVATIAELPYVLEGAGVPWSVNGDGNQVPTAAVVAYNDNASALDQVAVTRDTAHGYAWVDRNGVLQVWDRAVLPAGIATTLDESVYRPDLDLGWDLDSIINTVKVKALRVIATSGVTEEFDAGTFRTDDSVRKYGERAREFVIQGYDPAVDAALIEAWAQLILDENSTPSLRVKTVSLPIAGKGTATPDLGLALLDLYDRVTVENQIAGLSDSLRIRSVRHEIRATQGGGTWITTLGFGSEGTAPNAIAVPAPPPGVGSVKEEIDEELDDISETLGQLGEDLTELETITLPGVQQDLADALVDLGALEGKFPITGTDISNGAITTPKLATNAVEADKIAANAVTAAKIVGLSITGDKIAANTIGAGKITALSIGAAELAAGAITAEKVAAGAITAAKLDANAITGKSITGCTITGGSLAVTDVVSINSSGIILNPAKMLVSGGNWTMASVNISTSGTLAGSSVTGGDVYVLTSETSASAPNAHIGAGGRIRVATGSSERFKDNIVPILDLTAEQVYDLEPVQWTYKPGYCSDQRLMYGFTGEAAERAGLTNFVDHDDDGEVVDFAYARFSAAQQLAIRDLHVRLAALEASA